MTLLLQTLDIRTHLAWPTWTLVKEMVIMDYVMDTKTETDNLALTGISRRRTFHFSTRQ
jgi:hypothetical protein